MISKVRLRHWLGDHWKPLVIATTILFLVTGAAAAYSFTNPPKQIEQVETNQQTLTVNSTTTAVASGNNSLYDPGERLHNAPVYFTHITDTVNYTITITPPPDTSTSVDAVTSLGLRGETRDGHVFWETTEPLNHTTTTVTGDNTQITVTIPVEAVAERLGEKKAATRGSGLFSAAITLDLEYDTGTYQRTITESASITYQGNQVRLASINTVEDHSQVETRAVEQSPYTLKTIGLGIAAVLSLALAIWSVLIGREINTEALRYDVEHAKYSDWISHGQIPTYASEIPIRISSLRDLVNIAIDSNQRVIYNDDYRIYGILSDDILYYVPRDPEMVGQWFETQLPHIETDERSEPTGVMDNVSKVEKEAVERSDADEDYMALFDDSDEPEPSDVDGETEGDTSEQEFNFNNGTETGNKDGGQ